MVVFFNIELGFYPRSCTLVLLLETHYDHGVCRVYDGITYPSRLCEVRTCVTDRVILVTAHRIPLWSRQRRTSHEYVEGTTHHTHARHAESS